MLTSWFIKHVGLLFSSAVEAIRFFVPRGNNGTKNDDTSTPATREELVNCYCALSSMYVEVRMMLARIERASQLIGHGMILQ